MERVVKGTRKKPRDGVGTYAYRRAHHLCLDCDAPLPEDDPRKKCEACRVRAVAIVTDYRNTAKGRRTYRRWMRKRRKERRKAGICYRCPKPSVKGKSMCEDCLFKCNQSQQQYMERKGQGISLRRKPEPAVVPVPEPRPWQRVLRVATRFDEITNADVREVLGESEDAANALSQILGRLTRKGLLVRLRGGTGAADTAYAITPEGRKAA